MVVVLWLLSRYTLITNTHSTTPYYAKASKGRPHHKLRRCMITITIPGNPIPLQRHRSVYAKATSDRHIHSYNPQKKLQEQIYWTARTQMPGPPQLSDTPLDVTMTFYMPIPPSYAFKKRKLLPNQPHNLKPDLDNLIKMYCDSLNKLCWKDDSKIFKITATKLYSDLPRTVITIQERDNDKNQ